MSVLPVLPLPISINKNRKRLTLSANKIQISCLSSSLVHFFGADQSIRISKNNTNTNNRDSRNISTGSNGCNKNKEILRPSTMMKINRMQLKYKSLKQLRRPYSDKQILKQQEQNKQVGKEGQIQRYSKSVYQNYVNKSNNISGQFKSKLNHIKLGKILAVFNPTLYKKQFQSSYSNSKTKNISINGDCKDNKTIQGYKKQERLRIKSQKDRPRLKLSSKIQKLINGAQIRQNSQNKNRNYTNKDINDKKKIGSSKVNKDRKYPLAKTQSQKYITPAQQKQNICSINRTNSGINSCQNSKNNSNLQLVQNSYHRIPRSFNNNNHLNFTFGTRQLKLN